MKRIGNEKGGTGKKEISTAWTRIIRVDSSRAWFARILSVECDDDFFVCIVIGCGDPVVLEIGALVASPSNEVAKVTIPVAVVVF